MNNVTGERIGGNDVVGYKSVLVKPDGSEVTTETPVFLIPDSKGGYTLTKQYSVTQLLTPKFMISRNAVANWVPDKVYELYVAHDKKYSEAERTRLETALFEVAKDWYENDKAAIGQFVFKTGSTPYACIFYPHIQKDEDGKPKFCFMAVFSRTKLDKAYQHLMNGEAKAIEVEEVQEPDNDEMLAGLL